MTLTITTLRTYVTEAEAKAAGGGEWKEKYDALLLVVSDWE